LVDDLEERRRRWKSGWEAFWPDGPESEGFLLIDFTPSRIEVMSFARGIMEGPFTPATLVRREGDWVLVGG
jgi:general stress protein 26